MIRCCRLFSLLIFILLLVAALTSPLLAEERMPQRSPAPQVSTGFEKLSVPLLTAVTGSAAGPGVTVAVSAGGEVHSFDGSTWNTRFTATRPLADIAFGNDRFIAVGEGGTALSSDDGIIWKQLTTGITDDLRGVTWANGTWLAVGDNGTVATSATGDTWTTRTTGTTAGISQAVFTGTRWLAAGDDGTYCSSTDAVTWSCQEVPVLDGGQRARLSGVAAGNSIAVAAGPEVNPDGSPTGRTAIFRYDDTGKQSGVSILDNSYSGLCSGHGAFLLVGTEGRISVSADGISWTSRNVGDTAELSRCGFSANRFFVSGSGGALYRSKDVTGVQLEFSRSSLDFGNVAAGVGTRIRSLFAMNTGFVPITMFSATLNGGTDFVLDDGCSEAVLAYGEFCELEVRFSPQDTVEQTASITVASSDPQAPEAVIEVSGTGVINEVVSVRILGPLRVAPRHTGLYRIQATWKDGSMSEVEADDWTVDNEAAAAISSGGLFTAGAASRPTSVTITASCTIDGEVFDLQKRIEIREEQIIVIITAPDAEPRSWKGASGTIICRVYGSRVTAGMVRSRIATENPWIKFSRVSVSGDKARIVFVTTRTDSSKERRGVIDVDGQDVHVIQEGAPVRVEVSTTRTKFSGSGANAQVTVSAAPTDGRWQLTDIQWKPVAQAGWLEGFSEGESGEGSVAGVVTAAPNLSGRTRSVTLVFRAVDSGSVKVLKLTQLK